MADLKPCPFCGKEPTTKGKLHKSVYHKCAYLKGIVFHVWPEQWNNRPTEKAAREEVLEFVRIFMNTQASTGWIDDDLCEAFREQYDEETT